MKAEPRLSRTRMRRGLSVTLVSGLCVLATIYLATSGAGFSSLTTNVANRTQAGSFTLSDDDSSSVMFATLTSPTDSYLSAGQALTPRCINLTYTGSYARQTYSETMSGSDTDTDIAWSIPQPDKISLRDGILEMTPTYPGEYLGTVVETANQFDMRNSYMHVEIAQVIGGGADTALYGSDGNNDVLAIVKQGNFLVFGEKFRGVWNITTAPYNSSTMRWWKIKSIGAKIQFLYSANGKTWTLAREIVTRVKLDAMHVGLLASQNGTLSAPSTAIADNFTYGPNLATRLYANPSGTLAPYLNVTVERGTASAGGASHSCTGFTPTATVATNLPLDQFPTTYATGLDNWTPATSPSTVSYRFSITTKNGQTIREKTAAATFTWETRAGADP